MQARKSCALGTGLTEITPISSTGLKVFARYISSKIQTFLGVDA